MSSTDESAKSKVTTAMIFDYDMIKDNYNINLDITSGYAEEDEDKL